MDADGANPRRLDTGAERDDHAAWHPDGKQLLLVSERRGRSDLSLVAVPE
jgi:Tol biopolymer transport system component